MQPRLLLLPRETRRVKPLPVSDEGWMGATQRKLQFALHKNVAVLFVLLVILRLTVGSDLHNKYRDRSDQDDVNVADFMK